MGQIATAYLATNLVFKAVLGEVNDFVHRGQLPIGTEININAVEQFEHRKPEISGWVVLTNGWTFMYESGGVVNFSSPHSLENTVMKATPLKGKEHYTVDEAIKTARLFVQRLGEPLEDVFMDIPPEVQVEEGWLHQRWAQLHWTNPTMRNMSSVEIQVSLITGEITDGFLLHHRFRTRPVPKVAGYTDRGYPLGEAKKISDEEAAWIKQVPGDATD